MTTDHKPAQPPSAAEDPTPEMLERGVRVAAASGAVITETQAHDIWQAMWDERLLDSADFAAGWDATIEVLRSGPFSTLVRSLLDFDKKGPPGNHPAIMSAADYWDWINRHIADYLAAHRPAARPPTAMEKELAEALSRTRAKLRDFIRESPDPGADALAVEWEAGDVLARARAPGAL